MERERSKAGFEVPRGMRDFYPPEMSVRNAIFEAWSSAAREFGFIQYDSCVVESLGLFKRKSGEEITGQIYAFADKSGRELALRPEMTPTLARMVAARQNGLVFPLKWFSIAQCFRYERMSLGRKREHYQWNLDIVGEESVAAEVEALACAVRAMALLGLREGDFVVHFSSRALLAALLAEADIPESFHQSVFLTLDKRGKLDDAEVRALLVNAGLDEKNIESVFGITGITDFEQAVAIVGSDSGCVKTIRAFTDLLDQYGLLNFVQFDISVVRGLGYYTGIVFEAFDASGKFRALFGGGRYDNLLSDMGGRPATAVGLGFGDVVVGELLADRGQCEKYFRPYDMAVGFMTDAEHTTAIRVASSFRKSGMSVDLALSPEKARRFFSRAGKGGYLQAVYIGPDDRQQGCVRVKNLAEQSERELMLADLS